ncbi:uncharacterized protein BP5553_00049 [Venustampulla echinocandica]|uniref:Phosphatidylinositol-specific phospholipase C X domain-containing protein n=1 Tax=Venustampulla echinocandica TaxID=2656787 RepID=A0A370TX16_9HELO|nr:uncharacterized protein BP5553_00049 [Venustampulla echinocandica]RDL40070.1 hypothetical protein BP5553_00049 [Venustampulla echinocandica]
MLSLNFILWVSLSLSASAFASPVEQRNASPLAQFALQKVLSDASPIFGNYVSPNKKRKTETWMKAYPDSKRIVHMNIPGTHDASTWNYSQETQDALKHVTALNGFAQHETPPQWLRCQESSIATMLNAGIRAFDLRFAFDVTNSTLVFYHSRGLQSQTTTVEDLLFGLYTWLDDHPSEALFLSFQYEGGTTQYASNNAAVQMAMFNTLTSPSAKNYFLQTKGELGTLGQARGKITLFRRFDMDQLSSSYEAALPGLHFPPALWSDNGPDITLVYNEEKNLTAYIEDFYETGLEIGSSAELNIQLKYNLTAAHLLKATTESPDSLFWTWASSEYTSNVPVDTPRIMALGNGTELTPLGGVNQRLLPRLKQFKGKRVGIIMFDFFDTPSDLVETLLSL